MWSKPHLPQPFKTLNDVPARVLWFYRLPVVLGICMVTLGAIGGLSAWKSGPIPHRHWTTRRDCGAVSLYIVARLWGQENVSLDYLRALTESDLAGANMLSLKEAAQHLGFETHGLRLNERQLRSQLQDGAMAIVHLPVGSIGHFMPIVGMHGRDKFLVVDGVEGSVVLSGSELRTGWGWEGAALVLRHSSSSQVH